MFNRGSEPGSEAASRIVGGSDVMAALRSEIEAVAPLSSTVLLTGETGTGKGRVARIIHRLSKRSDRPFVHVDCAALSSTIIESELFGHERGSFTNAISRRAGRFELADNGTIFLDEIADLEPRLQSKLLRVLDDRRYERIGGTETLAMRARVIAATSHDLRLAVQEHRFRPDLYYRLNVFHLSIPPLRERASDIPGLVDDIVKKLAGE
ncbi:MAG: sigma-54 factor interaction domain-containing protein, partial [Myxococcota bacterium]